MKKFYVLLVSATVVVGGAWWALDRAFAQSAAPSPEGEQTKTLTKKQWEDLLQKGVAEALAKQQVSTETIGQKSNWHVVEFKGIEYTVYTGPGQALMARFVNPAAEAARARGAAGTASKSSSNALPRSSTGAATAPASRTPATRTPAP